MSDLVRVDVAMLMLGCSRTHIHNLVHAGVLHHYGPDKPWLLSYAEIGAAIDEGRITPRPDDTRRRVAGQ